MHRDAQATFSGRRRPSPLPSVRPLAQSTEKVCPPGAPLPASLEFAERDGNPLACGSNRGWHPAYQSHQQRESKPQDE